MREDFEQQLKNALARREPSAWFEQKVLAATRQAPVQRKAWWSTLFAGRMRWASAMAAMAVLVGGIAWERERIEERRQGEEAKARVELALKITSQKLKKISDRLDSLQERN